MSRYLFEDLTNKIIKCFYDVYDELGNGFVESVYEKSLKIELKDSGMKKDGVGVMNRFLSSK